MRLKRENESLVFSLSPAERRLLAHVLRELIEKYRLKPDELDAATMAVWYSSRGCATAGMSAEETKEWLEHLHAFKKGASLQRLEEWSAQLSAQGSGGAEGRKIKGEKEQGGQGAKEISPFPLFSSSPLPSSTTLRIPTEHAPAFVTAINDYRLAAAARHDIGQSEMDARSPWQLARLPPPRQQAVLEIHFLAWMIEETLRVASP